MECPLSPKEVVLRLPCLMVDVRDFAAGKIDRYLPTDSSNWDGPQSKDEMDIVVENRDG